MGLADFLFGSEDQMVKHDTMNPQQNQFLNQMLSQLMGMGGQGGGFGQSMNLLQQYLNPQSDIYKNFEQPYMREFQQQTIPMLAEKFAGLGGGMGAGGLASSGFGQSLGAAGSNLQTNLAQMKSGIQQNAIQQFLNQFNQMGQLGLGAQPFAYQHKQGSGGALSPLISAFAGGMGDAFGGMAASGLSNMFKPNALAGASGKVLGQRSF